MKIWLQHSRMPRCVNAGSTVRCLVQAGEIIEQFRKDGVVHEAYAGDRQRSVEGLRADLSHVLTGMLHQRELEACVKAVETEPRQNVQG